MDTVEFILAEFEPIPGGKLSLYELHQLDIQDKHTTIIPVASALHAKKVSFNSPGGGGISFEGISFVGGISIGVGGPAKLSEDSKFSISVLFGPGEFAQREIISTLKMLSNNIRSCLEALGKL